MPTISVEKNDLLHLIGRDYTVEKLESLLDYVKGELKDYDATTDALKIELKDTNRPDLWSPEGIARQLRYRFETIDYGSIPAMKHARPEKSILVDDNVCTVRPYIGAFIAKGLSVTEQFLIQMIQTQEKLCDSYGKKRELIAIGIYNAEKIVFPVHYKAVQPHKIKFVPLGYEEEMDLKEILERHPKGVEYAGILHGQDRYSILLDDRADVLSFPPVINSRMSGEVAIGDNYLFIEITGMNMDMTLHAVNILAYNFKDRGFEIEPVNVIYPYETVYGKEVASPYPLENEVEIVWDLFDQYLGNSYTTEEILTALDKYGLIIKKRSEDGILIVSTLPYRQDYMHAVDVVEDFTISRGYNTFEPVMPERFTVGDLSPMTHFEDRIRETMIGFGFEEAIFNILTNKEDFGEKVHGMYNDILEISNPMTRTYASLRNSLIPSLLKLESNSFKSVYPHKVFEVGEMVVRDTAENHGWATRIGLATLISHAGANFSEMGSYLMNLDYMMCWDTTIEAKQFPIFIEGRSGEIIAADISVGCIGEMHPDILDKWGIKMPTVVFEYDLTALFTLE